MSQPAVSDNVVISGHLWHAEATAGGYRLVIKGLDPGILDRACRDLVYPTVRLDYWELAFEGFDQDHAEVWFLSPVLGSGLHP